MPVKHSNSDAWRNESLPRICDYCHTHVASMQSDCGKWICDYCIIAALVTPAQLAQILVVQQAMETTAGWAVPITDALAEWRRQAGRVRQILSSPDLEMNAHAR